MVSLCACSSGGQLWCVSVLAVVEVNCGVCVLAVAEVNCGVCVLAVAEVNCGVFVCLQ